ncbi:MAG: hypothetical protein LBL63_05075 [Clostridiales Family XIII bacterium]|jgi:hypothetical protein|nr:hypothetical protein [Clostridiales Family XIII bacterium]
MRRTGKEKKRRKKPPARLVRAVVVAACVCTLMLPGCGEVSADTGPEEMVARVLDTLKEYEVTEFTATGAGVGAEYMEDVLSEAAGRVTEFEYKIGEATVRGDRAEVEVIVTAYPLGGVFEETADAFLTELAGRVAREEKAKIEADAAATESGTASGDIRGNAPDGITSPAESEVAVEDEAEALAVFESEAETAENNALFAARFKERLARTDKSFKKTVIVTLMRNNDGVWVLDAVSGSGDLVDAVYGGLPSKAAEFGEKALDDLFIRTYAAAFEEETEGFAD